MQVLERIGGGSINEAFKVEWQNRLAFCKKNNRDSFPELFVKERLGLELLAAQHVICTPRVLDCFDKDGKQYLIMEWVPQGSRTSRFWQAFGEQLALLHQKPAPYFGWDTWNYMGSIRQRNNPDQQWIPFFIHRRLEPMVDECSKKNLLPAELARRFEKLYEKLPDIFDSFEKPCVVHGDLWSGNFLCNQNESPVLIDPAAYFGHRCVDLAMTTLFGGFSSSFYEAYHYHFPLPSNYEIQWQICNLYPLLIHALLFGQSYVPSIRKTLEQFT